MLTFRQFIDEQMNQIDEGIPNPIFRDDKDLKRVEFLKNNITPKTTDYTMSKGDLIDYIESIHTRYLPTFGKIEKKLQNMIKKEIGGFKNTKLMTNLKNMEGIKSKVIDRGKSIIDINDFVRGAVLFDDNIQASQFVEEFVRKNKSAVVEFEEKEKGADKMYGYFGSFHLGVMIDGLVCELQVMSKKLWDYKNAAHKIYAAARDRPEGASKFDTSLSKKLFSLGNAPRGDNKSGKRPNVKVYENFLFESDDGVQFEFSEQELIKFGEFIDGLVDIL